MSEYVHVVFGDSARGSLRYFFKSNESEYKGEVIGLREDYSIGPICKIDTEEGMKKRIEYFKHAFETISEDEYLQDIDKDFIEMYKKIKNTDKEAKIIIWYGENANDQVGLRYLVSLLKDRELYEVNISDLSIYVSDDIKYTPRVLGECDSEEIQNLIPKIKKIDKEVHNNFIDEWKVLSNSKENLRVFKENKIVCVDETYYDNDILSNCTLNFRKATRAIGATMGKSGQLVSDLYIDYRVRKLIESGKLEYRGKLATMREFDIKVPGNLNKIFSNIFNKSAEIDENGLYHYLLEEKDDNLIVDTTHITKWDTIDLSNKLILDYNEDSLFSLTWFKEGRDLISINHIVISNIEYRTNEYEDTNGEVIKEEAIVIFSDNLTLMEGYLEIKIKPYISINLKIN